MKKRGRYENKTFIFKYILSGQELQFLDYTHFLLAVFQISYQLVLVDFLLFLSVNLVVFL